MGLACVLVARGMFFVFGIGKGGAVACFYGRFDWVWFDLLFFYSSSSSSSLEGGAKSLDAPALSASHRVRSAAAPLRATAALSPPPSFNATQRLTRDCARANARAGIRDCSTIRPIRRRGSVRICTVDACAERA